MVDRTRLATAILIRDKLPGAGRSDAFSPSAGPNRPRCAGPWTATGDNTGDEGAVPGVIRPDAHALDGGPLRAEPPTEEATPDWPHRHYTLGHAMKPTLRNALEDHELLGSALAGPTWHAWRACASAAMGEPLIADEAETSARFTGRTTPPRSALMSCGAGWVAVAARAGRCPCWPSIWLGSATISTSSPVVRRCGPVDRARHEASQGAARLCRGHAAHRRPCLAN